VYKDSTLPTGFIYKLTIILYTIGEEAVAYRGRGVWFGEVLTKMS
jgi:hypothetical protein